MKKILIIGATSAIAQATAKKLCVPGASFYLVGRNAEKLGIIQDDLKLRGAKQVSIDTMNPVYLEDHEFMLSRAELVLGHVDLALIAMGELPDQNEVMHSARKTVKSLTINAVSVISLATIIADKLDDQGFGTLAVISSVAGDRGRKGNYIYGAGKSAVSTFMEGLAARFQGTGVVALCIKPGFVDTPMTAQLPKGKLWAQPEDIADGIYRAVQKRKTLVYLPGFWWGIMLLIKLIPHAIMKRLSL